MKKGSGKDSSGRRGGLGQEDFLLWKAFTHDIHPLIEPDWEEAAPDVRAATQQNPLAGETAQPSKRGQAEIKAAQNLPPQPAQLDARTEARLKRGQMPVEGRLDLHGNTQDQAHNRLNEFILGAHARGKRCVLVITGKGLSRGGEEPSVGILRQKLPLWLSMTPLREVVLKFYPAVQRDGGTGAWYLYLKRQRDY